MRFEPISYAYSVSARLKAWELSMSMDRVVYVIYDSDTDIYLVDLNGSINLESESVVYRYHDGERLPMESTDIQSILAILSGYGLLTQG